MKNPHLRVERVFWRPITRRASSSGSFPGFGLRCSQSLFERFTFALLVFSNSWSSRYSDTSGDFERLVSCSWLSVFQELVRALGLLYVLVIFSD